MDWITDVGGFLHTVGSFLAIISFIVFIHEFGHYIVARWCGVRVEQFSIGFGRELWGWNDSHGTRWKLSLLPIGGYVKMFGDETAASTPDADKLMEMTEEEKKVAFEYKALWQKALVVAAGPAANFILSIGILIWFFTYVGYPETPATVGEVIPNSAAEQAGLQLGDQVLSINGESVERFSDMQRIIRPRPGRELPTVILRDGRELTLTITPQKDVSTDMLGNEVEIGLLGVQSTDVIYGTLSFVEAIPKAVTETWQLCKDTLGAVGEMITGQRSARELGGPIKIAQYSGQAADQDGKTVLWFMALLSVNLGLINLFPIPLLDGGHLLFYLIEAVTGRPLALKGQEYAFRIGFVLLISLMAFTTINDIVQLPIFG